MEGLALHLTHSLSGPVYVISTQNFANYTPAHKLETAPCLREGRCGCAGWPREHPNGCHLNQVKGKEEAQEEQLRIHAGVSTVQRATREVGGHYYREG